MSKWNLFFTYISIKIFTVMENLTMSWQYLTLTVTFRLGKVMEMNTISYFLSCFEMFWNWSYMTRENSFCIYIYIYYKHCNNTKLCGKSENLSFFIWFDFIAGHLNVVVKRCVWTLHSSSVFHVSLFSPGVAGCYSESRSSCSIAKQIGFPSLFFFNPGCCFVLKIM